MITSLFFNEVHLISKPFELFGLFQEPSLDRGGCRVRGQCPQVSSLSRVIVGDIPRERPSWLLAAHRLSSTSQWRNGQVSWVDPTWGWDLYAVNRCCFDRTPIVGETDARGRDTS